MEINQERFFERQGNKIRFSSTNCITWKQWNQILNKLNYLRYGFEDAHSVKEYFDRGTWLNEDQSLAVLEVFGLYRPEQLAYPAEQIKSDNEKAIEYFGVTSDWNQGGYLLTSGQMLDFSGGQGWIRMIDHRDIKDVIDIEEDCNGRLAMTQFMNYGNIRMMSQGIDLTIPPNEYQRQAISNYLKRADRFFVDISNAEGNVVQTFEHDMPYPGQVFRDIEEYFKALEIDVDLEEEMELS